MNVSPPWYVALEACRACPRRFLSKDLAKRVKFKGESTASAWLSKLRSWGYVEIVGTEENRDRSGLRRRPRNIWAVTEEGFNCQPIEGVRTRLGRLTAAVRELEKVRGTKGEGAAMEVLFRTYKDITERR